MSSSSILNLTNPMYVYTTAFIDELQRAGLLDVVVCPGSRSTPLAMTLVAQTRIRVWMHVDERSAAFFALGMAKRLARPVALVCTSGTAAANFLPAVVEAHLTHIPLLILTADRPHELRENGAPQAIDQNRLYGTHAKWFVDMALPEAVPAGPVHLNMPFREPLVPAPDRSLPLPSQRDPVAWEGRPDNAPYVRVTEARSGAEHEFLVERLRALISTRERGLI